MRAWALSVPSLAMLGTSGFICEYGIISCTKYKHEWDPDSYKKEEKTSLILKYEKFDPWRLYKSGSMWEPVFPGEKNPVLLEQR